jgi:CDP-glucose 4,6-dehydratase
MGTVNVLECVRMTPSVKSFVNVTTDKVYLNREWEWGYRENEELNGYDPYSNSKSCSELVTSSYVNSFFKEMDVAVSTARAGNVIGGGDFAADRIIPDCIRAVSEGRDIIVRNPFSTRPYQHVLEPVVAYLMIAKAQYEDKTFAGNYNVGPDEADCYTTGDLVTLFCEKWNAVGSLSRQQEAAMAEPNGDFLACDATVSNAIVGDAKAPEVAAGHTAWYHPARWIDRYDGGPHEANFLKLDCSKIKRTFGWKPRWNVATAMEKIVEWSAEYLRGGDVAECMKRQINEYLE